MTEEQKQSKPISFFEEAKAFPKMEVGDERMNVRSVTLQSITFHDRYVNTLEVEFMDIDPKYESETIHKSEKLLLPPSRMIGIDVIQHFGIKTFIAHFPIQIFSEVWNRTPVTPYVAFDGKTIIPCKIKLKKEESRWEEMYSIEIDLEKPESVPATGFDMKRVEEVAKLGRTEEETKSAN